MCILLIACNSGGTINTEEAAASLMTHKAELEESYSFVNEWDLNFDEVPELFCYNKQDTVVDARSGETHFIPDYSEGCAIYQVMAQDSIKQIATIFSRDELAGKENGFKLIETEILVTDIQLRNELIGEINTEDSLFMITQYTFNTSEWEYQKKETRFLLGSKEGGTFIEDL